MTEPVISVSDVETKFVSIHKNVAEHVINLETLPFQMDVLLNVLQYFVNLPEQQQNVPTLMVG